MTVFTFSFIKNTIIATTSTTPQSWQKSIYFHFSTITFSTPWWLKKITFSPIVILFPYYPLHRDYVKKIFFPTATTFITSWSWPKYVFISALRVLCLDHDIFFFHSSTTFSRSYYVHYTCDHDKKFFLCCCYVHYAVIVTKSMYFVFATTWSTPWSWQKTFVFISALRPLHPG